MRPSYFVVAAVLAAPLMVAAVWHFFSAESHAEGKNDPPKAAAAQGPSLPVTQIVLFTSGVGYFQREGEVNGNATTDLSFPVSNINDLLKSMVLQDLDGGQIKAVGYDSFDPVDKTLKSFALDLTSNPTFAQLLNQARGEGVEVDWQGQALKGSILGIERQRVPAGKDNPPLEVDVLNVLTTEGLRSLPLNQVQRVRFLNAHLDAELKRALEVLAQGHDTHKRTVSLGFTGQGKRKVKVAYVIENPIWKTSYRLVLDKAGKPFLQGWAIVDNASDEDWKNVQVTLISGRPISFQMNLYQPLYVARPWQELEMFAHLRPQVYGGDMAMKEGGQKAAKQMLEDQERVVKQLERTIRDEKITMAQSAKQDMAKDAQQKSRDELDLKHGVSADAVTGEVGQFFQYAIKQPVSLARQRSAMLPIVNQNIEGTRYSIYNAAVQAKHPLLGLKLKNTSDAHLMQGPITVFEGATYAGDARILDLQPNEERLLSYAVDQGMEVEPIAKSEPEEMVSIKIIKGILQATYKLQQTSTYNIKNRATQDRVLLVEHPIRADWKLLNDKEPLERSRDVYRYKLDVASGKSASQKVVEERSRLDHVSLTTSDDQSIRYYLSSKVISSRVKEALEKAIAYKVKLAETQREMNEVNKQIKAVAEDQARIRANMERVPQNSAPYTRYLKKLDEQETQIETYQGQVMTLRRREEEQRREYEEFLTKLNLED